MLKGDEIKTSIIFLENGKIIIKAQLCMNRKIIQFVNVFVPFEPRFLKIVVEPNFFLNLKAKAKPPTSNDLMMS